VKSGLERAGAHPRGQLHSSREPVLVKPSWLAEVGPSWQLCKQVWSFIGMQDPESLKL